MIIESVSENVNLGLRGASEMNILLQPIVRQKSPRNPGDFQISVCK